MEAGSVMYVEVYPLPSEGKSTIGEFVGCTYEFYIMYAIFFTPICIG